MPANRIRLLKLQRSLHGNVAVKNAEPLLPAAVDPRLAIRQTPLPVVSELQGAGFWSLPNPQLAASGAVGRGGLAGARKRLQRPTAFFGRREIFRKLENQAVFGASYSLALGSTKPADSTEPIVPASPNRPAVPDARYLLHLTFTGYNAFIRRC